MKLLVFFIFITISSNLLAKEYKLLAIGKSLSIHPMANETATKFSNALSKDGVFVVNEPTITYSYLNTLGKEYTKWTLVYSRDCVDSPVYGLVYSSGSFWNKYAYGGLVIGGYFMNSKRWKEREITQSWISLSNNTTGKNTAFVPMIGGEVNVRIFKIGAIESNWNTYINPVLVNTTISIGFSF